MNETVSKGVNKFLGMPVLRVFPPNKRALLDLMTILRVKEAIDGKPGPNS
jgi:hypothetical protein